MKPHFLYEIEMVENEQEFRDTIKILLQSDDGIAIESEGTVYIRSLEGCQIVAGILGDAGGISYEKEFAENIDVAIEYFCAERNLRNHGSVS
ncbi:hypothetical protein [Gimesia algae]|nr:hypothetical protein [Gimesia algae]